MSSSSLSFLSNTVGSASSLLLLWMLGMGDPAYFYVSCVFLLNGAMMSLFFIYGAYLR